MGDEDRIQCKQFRNSYAQLCYAVFHLRNPSQLVILLLQVETIFFYFIVKRDHSCIMTDSNKWHSNESWTNEGISTCEIHCIARRKTVHIQVLRFGRLCLPKAVVGPFVYRTNRIIVLFSYLLLTDETQVYVKLWTVDLVAKCLVSFKTGFFLWNRMRNSCYSSTVFQV